MECWYLLLCYCIFNIIVKEFISMFPIIGSSAAEGGFSPEAVDTSNTFGEDMLQMALKMASELEEPAVDLEAALTPSTITAQSQTSMEQNDG
jgi:hypothetical protein